MPGRQADRDRPAAWPPDRFQAVDPPPLQSGEGQDVLHEVAQPRGFQPQGIEIVRCCWGSGTIPSLSISVYMWKVVSGVRSSCVTAETKSARRWPSRMTFASRAATAAAARSTHGQATGKIQRIGERQFRAAGGRRAGNQPQRQRGQHAGLILRRSGQNGQEIGLGQQIAHGFQQPGLDRRPVQQASLEIVPPIDGDPPHQQQLAVDPERRHQGAAQFGRAWCANPAICRLGPN